jgi:formylglycine-generating enzyme required for sulfatase activity
VLNVQTRGGVDFIRIPAGNFIMGSKDDELASDNEKPQHSITISHPYWLARYPVTNEQFAIFVESTKYVTIAENEGGWSRKADKYLQGFNWQHSRGPESSLQNKNSHPVVQVSWHEAMEYCKWLNTLIAKIFKLTNCRCGYPPKPNGRRVRVASMAMNGRGVMYLMQLNVIPLKVA